MVNVSAYRPRPGLHVIPPGWEAHHKPVADGTRTAEVEVWTGPSGPEWVWDPDTKDEVRDHGTLITAGTARIQRLQTESETTAGEQDVTTRRYLVTLDREIGPGLTDRSHIHVTTSGDPLLNGRWLAVLDIQGGSLRWERDLICEDNLEAVEGA